MLFVTNVIGQVIQTIVASLRIFDEVFKTIAQLFRTIQAISILGRQDTMLFWKQFGFLGIDICETIFLNLFYVQLHAGEVNMYCCVAITHLA